MPLNIYRKVLFPQQMLLARAKGTTFPNNVFSFAEAFTQQCARSVLYSLNISIPMWKNSDNVVVDSRTYFTTYVIQDDRCIMYHLGV